MILGGCFIDGGEGGGFGGYERLMHDAWQGAAIRRAFSGHFGQVGSTLLPRSQALALSLAFRCREEVEWTPWGTQMDERGRHGHSRAAIRAHTILLNSLMAGVGHDSALTQLAAADMDSSCLPCCQATVSS